VDWEKLRERVLELFDEYQSEHEGGGYADMTEEEFLKDFGFYLEHLPWL
jgi:hypothetical protein